MGKNLRLDHKLTKRINYLNIMFGLCLTLKNVESKTTFKDGDKRKFRIVGVAGTRI